MKYLNIKRYKFSTIFKRFDLPRYRFTKIYKYIHLKIQYFSKLIKYTDPRKYNFSKLIKYTDPRNYNFSKLIKYFNFRRYNFSKILNLKKFEKVPTYFFGAVVLSLLIYLNIPLFHKYNKSNMEKEICDRLNISCEIKGDISYNFFPSPRVIVKNIIIKDFKNKKKIIGNINTAATKLSLYNLHDKDKVKYTKINLNKPEFIINFKNIDNYKNFFKKNFGDRPINIKNGELKFFDGEKYITSIKDISFEHDPQKNGDESTLNGKFLDDDIFIEIKSGKKSSELSKILTLKLSDFKIFTKVEIFNPKNNDSTINGNILFKKNKNRLTGIFDYKDNKLTFKKGNLRNLLLDGKFSGEIEFLPFFNFNLDVNLNGINFNKLHGILINFDKQGEKNLFEMNRKINGKLNLSADKIYSKYNLIDAFESRIQFINGNILVEKMLLNLGKLGAADIIGTIKNDKKYSNFKFQNNIFIDNLKRFYSKFGIFNKQKDSSELFVEGNFDLKNYIMHFSEIHYGEKVSNEDISYIQREFNEILLEEKYESLFDFRKFKEFIKSITSESN